MKATRIIGNPARGSAEALRCRRSLLIRTLPCIVACLAVALLSLAPCRINAQTGVPATGGAQTGVTGGVTGGVMPAGGAQSQTTNPATSVSPTLSQSMLYPGEDFRLSPGDLIAVHLFGSADYFATVRIGLDGTVELPYIKSVPLEGLTVRMAQSRIEDRLRSGGFYQDPEITIQVLDTVNGTVTITGEVRATVPVATERSLREVILAAGGLPANASHTVKIVRPGVEQPIVVDLGADLAASAAANIPVRPHDIIQITRANVVYVLGAFKAQGAVPLDQSSPLTLMQLAALSGGVGWEGRYQDLRLIRTVGTERKLVEVDIKRVLNGKAPDPVLQANDIIFLPTNQMKAALKSLGIGGVLGFVSLIYSLHTY
jgi:polysaccharide biosynthesis/export protein